MAVRIGHGRIHLGAYFDRVRALDARALEHFKPARNGEIRKVAAFRADRIGDAFVCLPLFIEMDKKYELTVFSSPYNDFILRKAGLKTSVYDNPAFYREDSFAEFVRSLVLFNTAFPFRLLWARLKRDKPRFDLFLLQDLSPVRRDFIVEADCSARFLASPFLGHFVLPLTNFALFRRYLVTDPKPSPMAQYYQAIRYFDPDFSFLPRADALNFLAEGGKDAFQLPSGRFIVFHVGGKAARLVHDRWVTDFLNQVDVPVVVIDDDSKTTLHRLREEVGNRKVSWVLTHHSLFEYLTLVLDDRCAGYIGYDGGHSHLLSLPKSSVTLYTMGEHEKWRTYTGNPYKKVGLRDGISMEFSPLGATTKAILYRDLACSPCYYRPCADPLCRAIPLADCWEPVRPLFGL